VGDLQKKRAFYTSTPSGKKGKKRLEKNPVICQQAWPKKLERHKGGDDSRPDGARKTRYRGRWARISTTKKTATPIQGIRDAGGRGGITTGLLLQAPPRSNTHPPRECLQGEADHENGPRKSAERAESKHQKIVEEKTE